MEYVEVKSPRDISFEIGPLQLGSRYHIFP